MKGSLAAMALLVAAPGLAQERELAEPDFASLSDAELDQRYQAILAESFIDACAKAPLLAEVARRNPQLPAHVALQRVFEAYCAAEQGRNTEGLQTLKQAETQHRVQPQDALGLQFAIGLEDGAEALERLRRLARDGTLPSWNDQFIFAGIRTIRAGGQERAFDEFSDRFAVSREFARLGPALQATFAAGAMRHRLARGELSGLDELLVYNANPGSFLTFLADRKYEPAWSAMERFAGPNLANVSDAYVGESAAYLAEKPEDGDRLSRYAYALLYAGRFAEAIDVARAWRPDRNPADDFLEGEGWALNVEAFALDALARVAEADAVLDQLAALPADRYPWVVNFVINRASRLVGQGRWAEGLAATELARSVAEAHGSTYAKLLIARDRACALQRLGRPAESAPELDFLREHFNESASVAASGLLCAGMTDEVSALLARALGDERGRASLIDDMQDPRFELFYTPSVLPQARDIVLANDDLRQEILKHIRLLPEDLVPIAYLRREAARGQGPAPGAAEDDPVGSQAAD